MTEAKRKKLLDLVLNELDITFNDEKLKNKIGCIMDRGVAYLEDKFGATVDFIKDKIAMELLFSYCRYGRSNAIEQFEHDFKSNLTAFALRGAMETAAGQKEGAKE